MNGDLPDHLLLIVTGASFRAERMDRPLAYRLREEVLRRMVGVVAFDAVVVSDIWYLNSEGIQERPVISIGGPGVNHLAGYLLERVPMLLVVENVFQIQMDPALKDWRCSIWGMDHETTVEAVDTFCQKGHLDRFLSAAGGFPQALA